MKKQVATQSHISVWEMQLKILSPFNCHLQLGWCL